VRLGRGLSHLSLLLSFRAVFPFVVLITAPPDERFDWQYFPTEKYPIMSPFSPKVKKSVTGAKVDIKRDFLKLHLTEKSCGIILPRARKKFKRKHIEFKIRFSKIEILRKFFSYDI